MSEAAAANPAWRRLSPLAPARLLSEERLAQRAAAGDERAFAEIYDRHVQGIYRFCLAMLGNPQDAQDAVQNTMVKALRALPGEERRIQLKPWLYRVARNEAVELIRRRPATAEAEPDQTVSLGDPAETVEARERLRSLIEDLEELPERQRAALVMRELVGLPFEQIGDAFETSPAVARQTVYEARLSLRQMEAGREMTCREVTRELSDMDGRVARRRELRAHLRSCADCRAFREAISRRHTDLAAIAPLPAAVSTAILGSVLGGTGTASAAGGAAATGLAGTIGAGAGKAVGASAIVKAAATAAVVAAVGVGAERGGLIEVPVGGDRGDTSSRQAPGKPGNDAGSAGARAGEGGGAMGRPAGGTQSGKGASQGRRGAAAGSRGQRRSAKATSRSGGGAPDGVRGHGRAHGKGKPQGLPAASGRGQQTAASHKAPQARAEPGPGGSKRGGTVAPARPSPAPAPAPVAPPAAGPPQEKAAHPQPPLVEPPAEPPATQGSGGGTGSDAP